MALAVISLMQTLEQLLDLQLSYSRIYKNGETFQNKLCSLRDLILQNSCTDGNEVKGLLETKIINVACKAEDVIASNLLDVRNGVEGAEKRLRDELKNLMDEIHSVVKEVKKLKKKKGKKVVGIEQGRTALSSPQKSSYRDYSFPTTTVVGLDDDFRMITDRLRNSRDLLVVSIVGMGGIGKTTLAKSVYRDSSVVEYFDRCGWITVSQEFQERQVYLGILCCFGYQSDEELEKKSNDQLAEQVYKSLKGRRYLIVLDDVWSTTTWDHLRRLLPNDGTGSRVLLTTRLVEVALYASSGRPPHHMRFLSIEEGWELLSGKVFGKQCCPSKLEEIGKQIVFKCRGLPLAILVVAGLVSKVNHTIEDWKSVLENLNALVSTNAEDCFGILGLSYHQLPFYLKSCFVYTALFPEDAAIPVPKLIKLWIAEGLLGKVRRRSEEEVAEAYMEELIDRSLVLICKRGSNGKAKTCMVHDLLRELCLREANAQKFLLACNHYSTALPADMNFHSRFIFQSWKWEELEKIFENGALNKSRSVLIVGMSYVLHWSVKPNFGRFKLLRVLDASSVSFSSFRFTVELKDLIYLRYLAVSVANVDTAIIIEDFVCLQTLIVRNSYPTLIELIGPDYKMEQLRHMELGCGEISGLQKNKVFFPNLQTLSGLSPVSCGRELFWNIPNLKKFGLSYCDDRHGQPDCLGSVHLLHNLAVLKFQYTGNIPYGIPVSQKLNLPKVFPLNLKKLTLLKSCLPWKDITVLAKLPNLEILKLKKHAFMGPEWVTTDEDSFLQLMVLVLESLDLVHWKVSSDHFPKLQRLIIRHCYHLEGIPLEIGDITTLQELELDRSNTSVMDSAKEILEELQNWRNDDEFHVHFNSSLRVCK